LLRRSDQAVVAWLVVLSLVGMAAYWVVQGGLCGRLVMIDRAAPLEARFRVDLNRAEWPELSQLPQVGETLARRIVESRNVNGPFKENEDLKRVRGIGPRTYELIKPYLLPRPTQLEVVSEVSQRSKRIP
jgi:competence protein ComEA